MDKTPSPKVKKYCMSVARRAGIFSRVDSINAARIEHDCLLVDMATGETVGECWLSMSDMTQMALDGGNLTHKVKEDSKPRVSRQSYEIQEPNWIAVFDLLSDDEIEHIEKYWEGDE